MEHVAGLDRHDGYEKVAAVAQGIAQVEERGGIAGHRHYIVAGIEHCQFVGVFVYQQDVLLLVAEQLCKMRAYLSGPRYYYFHSSGWIFKVSAIARSMPAASVPHRAASSDGVPCVTNASGSPTRRTGRV